jgi:fatty-acyl-CoA synthase
MRQVMERMHARELTICYGLTETAPVLTQTTRDDTLHRRVTTAAIREGWLHTRDLAVRDEQGYVQILGRVDDMIIRGGENVYPREIEEFLYTHPKVKDIAVVGVPSEKYGEEVMAFIQLREGERASIDEIQEYCQTRISRFKVPKYVAFVDAYPMTASGKIQKFKLRELGKAMLSPAGRRVA